MDADTERALLAEYPFHIVVLVKAVQAALEEGRATILDGRLVFHTPTGPSKGRNRGVSRRSSKDGPSDKLQFG